MSQKRRRRQRWRRSQRRTTSGPRSRPRCPTLRHRPSHPSRVRPSSLHPYAAFDCWSVPPELTGGRAQVMYEFGAPKVAEEGEDEAAAEEEEEVGETEDEKRERLEREEREEIMERIHEEEREQMEADDKVNASPES